MDEVLFMVACALSVRHLPGYATLDASHVTQIRQLIHTIQHYADDLSQKRPLNFLMLAAPGAGKSHFIKCIASQLASHKVSPITYNMAGMQTSDDLVPPLDSARNLKVEDHIPLLFFDEFDSEKRNIAFLLPLLWDGEVNIGQRDLKLGRVIVVLAGSDPSLPETMEEARSMRQEMQFAQGPNPKLVDLLSRINGGVFHIPPFVDDSRRIDRRVDKVCIVVHLLRQRFGHQLRAVPLSLLRFVARREFRYGVRSIAHLVDLIPHKKNAEALTINDIRLQLDSPHALKASSLAYHLIHGDQALGVVNAWKELSKNASQALVWSPWIESLSRHVPDQYFADYILHHLLQDVVQHGRQGTSTRKTKSFKKRMQPTLRKPRRG